MACLFSATIVAQPPKETDEPPTTWVDKDTGHRVWRLTNEPNSSGLYFNVNAFTSDGRSVIYTAQDGLYALDLTTRKTHLVVAKKAPNQSLDVISAGRKTNSVFFTRGETVDGQKIRALCKADIYTGEVTRLCALPLGTAVGMTVLSINSDETLVAGSYEEGPPAAGSTYDPRDWTPPLDHNGKPQVGTLIQATNKSEMMDRRFNARIPVALFVVDLQSGKMKPLLHTTDWLTHFLFSPADPSLLMYCHEGHWEKVDRIWFIRTDTAENKLIHKREMAMEIAGHEFWGIEGKTIWYDLQTPAGDDYWLGGYNTKTHQRMRYHMQAIDWSLHFNVTEDETLLCGDGGDPAIYDHAPGSKWIELLRPSLKKNRGSDDPDLIRPGNLRAEHLVDMSKHDYHLEPNVRFTPDKKMVLFTSNMFGPSYVFGVEVQKAAP